MAERNPFDQFDEPENKEVNPFDQFDSPDQTNQTSSEAPQIGEDGWDNFQIEPGFQEGIKKRAEESNLDTSLQNDAPLRSYKDLYENTLNKYPDRIRSLYLQRMGQQQFDENLPNSFNPLTGFGAFSTLNEEEQKQYDQMENDLQEVYNQAGEEGTWDVFGIPIKARFQYKVNNNPDFDPTQPEDPEKNPSMISKKYFISPPDQSQLMRMSYQVVNNIVAGLGDLSQGYITQEGPVSKALPDMVPNSEAEDFTTELTSLVIGPEMIKGAIKTSAEGVKMASRMGQGNRLATKARDLLSPEALGTIKNTYQTVLQSTGSAQKAMKAANSVARPLVVGLGYGLVDASIMENDSEGLLSNFEYPKETIKDIFGVDDRRAMDIANTLDTPIINGTIGMFGGLAMAVSDKVIKPGLGGLRNVKPLGLDIDQVLGRTPGLGITQADAGLKTLSFIDPNIKIANDGKRNASVEDFIFRTKMLGDSLERHAKKNIQLAGAGKEISLDTPSAFLPAVEDYYRYAYAPKKDLMGEEAFNKWVKEQATQSANRMFELKTAVAGNANVASKMSNTANDLSTTFDEAAGSFSPTGKLPDVQDAAAEKLVQSERDIVGNVNKDLETFEVQAANDKAAFDSALQNDPTLSELMKQADLTDNLGSNKEINDRLAKALPENLYQSYKTLKTANDDAYKKIADSGADADVGSFLETIKSIPGATDAEGTLVDPFLKKIAEQAEADGSFANLYNNVNNEINKKIKSLKQGDEDYRQGLFDLKKNIKEDQIEFLKSNGDGDVAQMAQDANDAYIKLRTSFGDSMATRDIEQLGRARLAGEKLPAGVGPGQGVTDFNIGSNKIVRDALEGPTGNEALQSIRRAAEAGGKGGEVNSALVDYYSSQAVKNISNMMQKGSTPTVKSVRNEIKNLTTTLENLDSPIMGQLMKIDNNLASLEGAKNLSEEQLTAFKEQVADVYNHSRDSAVAKFIYKYDPKYAKDAKVNSNPDRILDNIFAGPDSVNDVKSLYDRAATLGEEGSVIRDAIKGSYLDYTKRQIFGRKNLGIAEVGQDGTVKSGFAVNDGKIDKFFNSTQNIKNLRTIFEDEPKVVDELMGVVNLAKNSTTLSKRSADDILGSVPPELDPTRATNTLVTLVWGALNPTATRVRRFTTPASIKSLEQVKAIRESTLVAMVTDPKEFADIIRTSADQAALDISVNRMRELIYRSGIKAYLNEGGEYKGPSKLDKEMSNLAGPSGEFPGMIEKGNIDLANRPIVKNDDGSISTVRSMSFEEDGQEILVPTVSPDGRILEEDEAIDLYHKTGKFLGKFDNPEDADAYAQSLHEYQDSFYSKKK